MLDVKRTDSKENSNGNTMLLEKEDVFGGYRLYDETPVQEETEEQARERQSRNLERILNYDKCVVEEDVVREEKTKNLIAELNAVELTKEDLEPSSTTMQFEGRDSAEEFYNKSANEEGFTYNLNKKGKLMIAIYSVAVAVILALIVLNSGVITAIQSRIDASNSRISQLNGQYAELQQNISDVSTNDYVIDRATDMGMVEGK
ncbi:MAG: hypothetical protein MJ072_04225 [Clostridia bacterium]|nr:hypothetical protein [Clostridia bacterium]